MPFFKGQEKVKSYTFIHNQQRWWMESNLFTVLVFEQTVLQAAQQIIHFFYKFLS